MTLVIMYNRNGGTYRALLPFEYSSEMNPGLKNRCKRVSETRELKENISSNASLTSDQKNRFRFL